MVLTSYKLPQRKTHISEREVSAKGFIVEIINCLASLLEAVLFEHNTEAGHFFVIFIFGVRMVKRRKLAQKHMVLTNCERPQRETHIPEKGFSGKGFIVEIINCLASHLEAVRFEHNTEAGHFFVIFIFGLRMVKRRRWETTKYFIKQTMELKFPENVLCTSIGFLEEALRYPSSSIW